jgi:hypothetical protein
MAKQTAYSATGAPYHYAGGVVAAGESAELSDTDAARGLSSGALVVTPTAATKASSKTEES